MYMYIVGVNLRVRVNHKAYVRRINRDTSWGKKLQALFVMLVFVVRSYIGKLCISKDFQRFNWYVNVTRRFTRILQPQKAFAIFYFKKCIN